MKVTRAIAVLMLPVFLFTGCASIVGKDVFPVTINSNPDGAKILVKDENGVKVYSGTTPTTVTLSAGEAYFHAKSYTVTLSKPGYCDQYIQVKAGLSGWYFGNIIFGGLIGLLIVDPITGKMFKLKTNYWAELDAQETLVQPQPLVQPPAQPLIQPPIQGVTQPPVQPMFQPQSQTQPPAQPQAQPQSQSQQQTLKKTTRTLRIVTIDQVPEAMKKDLIALN